MKKLLYIGLSICLFIVFISIGVKVEANPNLFLDQFRKTKIEINGNLLKEEDVPPFIVNGRTVLPVAQVAKMLNAVVGWDENRKIVTITKPIVNMSIINVNRSRNEIEVNPIFEPRTHSFQVATQVSRVPISKNLKVKFVVTDSSNRTIKEQSFTIDTEKVNGSFQGNLDVAGLSLSHSGEYILKLQMEDPGQVDKFITIGEYVLTVK